LQERILNGRYAGRYCKWPPFCFNSLGRCMYHLR
jgi:hypothetical protein